LIAILQFRIFLSPFPSPKKNQQLITKGIFSLSRHPVYTGIFIYFIGKALEKASVLGLGIGIVFLVFAYFKASYEEDLLSEKFAA
jgi:protein-S-isoprenylcysteine O-methyltransferase Ste14